MLFHFLVGFCSVSIFLVWVVGCRPDWVGLGFGCRVWVGLGRGWVVGWWRCRWGLVGRQAGRQVGRQQPEPKGWYLERESGT